MRRFIVALLVAGFHCCVPNAIAKNIAVLDDSRLESIFQFICGGENSIAAIMWPWMAADDAVKITNPIGFGSDMHSRFLAFEKVMIPSSTFVAAHRARDSIESEGARIECKEWIAKTVNPKWLGNGNPLLLMDCVKDMDVASRMLGQSVKADRVVARFNTEHGTTIIQEDGLFMGVLVLLRPESKGINPYNTAVEAFRTFLNIPGSKEISIKLTITQERNYGYGVAYLAENAQSLPKTFDRATLMEWSTTKGVNWWNEISFLFGDGFVFFSFVELNNRLRMFSTILLPNRF